jgi:hypothetical protein
VRDTTFEGWGHENCFFLQFFKVSRQCPPIRLVEVRLRESVALRSEDLSNRMRTSVCAEERN